MSVIAPDPTIDFVGLFADQDESVILARMIDWANEGLDRVADADRWVDTREGGHWRTAIMPCVREIARLYDLAGTEVPMSGFVLWAWGSYLDDLAAAYTVYRLPATYSTGQLLFSGPAGTVIADGTTEGTQPVGPDDPAPTFSVTGPWVIPDLGGGMGSVSVPIRATEAGKAGDVAANAITVQSTPLPAGVTFTNPAPTGGGSDPETDDRLRTRVLQAIAGRGPGNIADYIRWASAWPSVGSVKVVPTPTGPNSVLVMIGNLQGQPLPGSVVAGLQNDLDPVPGKGSGTAPVGAHVDVETSVSLPVTVVAVVTYMAGYSSLGVGNTVAVHDDIFAAIAAYLLTVAPGGVIRNSHVAGIIATWPGVDNVTAVQLNGGADDADVAVGLTPPQSPLLTTLTI